MVHIITYEPPKALEGHQRPPHKPPVRYYGRLLSPGRSLTTPSPGTLLATIPTPLVLPTPRHLLLLHLAPLEDNGTDQRGLEDLLAGIGEDHSNEISDWEYLRHC